MNPRRHPVVLLVALVSTYAVIMLGLLILFPYAGSLKTAEASSVNQYPLLSLQLSPNPAQPESSITVTGNVPTPDENSFAFEETYCDLYANQSDLIQSPNCQLRSDGSITGSFQVSSLAQPGTALSIFVHTELVNMFPLYSLQSQFSQYCSALTSAQTVVVSSPSSCSESCSSQTYVYTGNSGAYCMFIDNSILDISNSATTTTLLLYQTQYRTLTLTTTKVEQVLNAPEAILTASVTAVATGAATRIYGKRRPGFDVEVRSGIDRKESQG